MLGPAFDAAFEHRFERLVRGVARLEGQIVAKQDEAFALGLAEMSKQARQRADVLAVDLHELEAARRLRSLAAYRRMHCLDQRALAGAACAPQKRIVGGKALREAHGVVEKSVAHAVDALEQGERHAIDRSDR